MSPVGQAQAQAFGLLEGLFDSVNSVSLSVQGGWLDSEERLSSFSEGTDLVGLGTEVYLNLPGPKWAFLELSLGTTYLRGFEATEPTLDLRGSLRALPTISIYATRMFENSPVAPYIGINFGFLELWNSQAYDPQGNQISVKAQTYEYGGTLGLNLDVLPSLGFFLEGNYKRRRFASVQWGTSAVPQGWPRSLNLSGPGLSFGLQFNLSEVKQTSSPGAPSYSGTWILKEMDGLGLPGLFEQQHQGQSSTRQSVMMGSLLLGSEQNATYSLLLQLRDETINAEGNVVAVQHPRFIEESGHFAKDGDLLLLLPTGQSTRHELSRRGNDLLLRLGDTNHLLLLSKRR